MLRIARHLTIGFLSINIIFVCCKYSSDELTEVHNISPKYIDEKYVQLEKVHSIDVTQISLFSKDTNSDIQRLIDFDENNNIYILDSFKSTISVFNEQGGFVRAFGRAGQGPKEFLRPNTIIVNKDKVYVFQGFHEYKIVDLDGEYISSHLVNVENRLKTKIVGDRFYLLRGKVDQSFTKLELILSRYNVDFSMGNDIFMYEYPSGFQGPHYDFNWANWLLILDNGEFYFPDANLREFSITKYNVDGEPRLKFTRRYNLKEYSKEARNRFYSLYKKQIESGDMVFPKTPPVVRFMFQDNKENIWVISGETFEDNRNPDFENTIDIFSNKGKWLYSFKSKFVSRYCFYNNGRVYRVLPINLDTFDQYIEVYQIEY
jgi:hypothetical protein